MGYKFGEQSQKHRATLHPALQDIVDLALEETEEDFAILCGHRDHIAQADVFIRGKSKAVFGESRHNFYPSLAVDVVPYPVDWDDEERFARLAEIMCSCANKLGFHLEWGGMWSNFKDLPHFELHI